MKQILSRRSLLLDVVVVASFLYFTVSGLYGGPGAGEAAAQVALNSASGDGGLPSSTEKGRDNETLNAHGTRKKERKKKEKLERQRNIRAPLPVLEPSGGAALRGIDLAEYTPEIKQLFDHKLVYDLYPGPQSPEERARVLKNSVRVIIVRHPFSRILSVYRDKMATRNPRPLKFNFKELQAYIRKTYRSRHTSNRSRFPSFPEFIQYVIDSTGNFTRYEDWKENVNCWLPYWVRCTVCSLDYNIIIKLETMEEDKRFLATLSRLNELKDKDTWMHLRTAPSSDLGAKYYKQLTRHQILQLYERYEPDFKLFQYDIKDYLDNAIDSRDRSTNS